MATITDFSNLFGFTSPLTWRGVYAASTGTQDTSSSLNSVTGTYVQTATVTTLSTRAKLTRGFNTYYKMQGYNTATNIYEVWFSTGAPLLTPPSGNLLSQIEVVTSWIDR